MSLYALTQGVDLLIVVTDRRHGLDLLSVVRGVLEVHLHGSISRHLVGHGCHLVLLFFTRGVLENELRSARGWLLAGFLDPL